MSTTTIPAHDHDSRPGRPRAHPPPEAPSRSRSTASVTGPEGDQRPRGRATHARQRHQRVLLPPGPVVAAQCRQCLVVGREEPEAPAELPAGRRQDGGLTTTDAASTLARKQKLEFTLLNHPIDCPICDKAGECTLQKLYFDHDNADSRVDVPKVHKAKVVDLGPHIVLDQERCILCSRCIRVCDEVAGQHQLEFANRGDHEVLTTAPGRAARQPVLAQHRRRLPGRRADREGLPLHDARLGARRDAVSVCNGCATGCNIEIHHKNGRAWRLVPRHNPDGQQVLDVRRGSVHLQALRDERLAAPLVGRPAGAGTGRSRRAAQALRLRSRDARASRRRVRRAVERRQLRAGDAWREAVGRRRKRYLAGPPGCTRRRQAPRCRHQSEHRGIKAIARAARPLGLRDRPAAGAVTALIVAATRRRVGRDVLPSSPLEQAQGARGISSHPSGGPVPLRVACPPPRGPRTAAR